MIEEEEEAGGIVLYRALAQANGGADTCTAKKRGACCFMLLFLCTKDAKYLNTVYHHRPGESRPVDEFSMIMSLLCILYYCSRYNGHVWLVDM